LCSQKPRTAVPRSHSHLRLRINKLGISHHLQLGGLESDTLRIQYPWVLEAGTPETDNMGAFAFFLFLLRIFTSSTSGQRHTDYSTSQSILQKLKSFMKTGIH